MTLMTLREARKSTRERQTRARGRGMARWRQRTSEDWLDTVPVRETEYRDAERAYRLRPTEATWGRYIDAGVALDIARRLGRPDR